MATARYVCPVCGKSQGVRLVSWDQVTPALLERTAGEPVVVGQMDRRRKRPVNRECLACGNQWSETEADATGRQAQRSEPVDDAPELAAFSADRTELLYTAH